MELIPLKRTIYLVTGYVDMRMGTEKLLNFVKYRCGIEPTMKNQFLFCGRSATKMKVLYLSDDTTEMRWIRFEQFRLQWPREPDEVWQITYEGAAYLISGLDMKPNHVVRIIDISGKTN